ncbi:MAG: FAD-dependent thymidylate synthase [Selenomonadaceae bacterium]|nr:FAD-dependent thymidylate synthase [Selenomonadaceae bacterium]MBR0102255.1 FAD-dependent thymidylate synthase [Selenomonadaceae bacterium]
MKIIEPSVELVEDFDAAAVIQKLERAGRVCYKSEGNIKADSAEKFIRGIIKRGHESVIEHATVSFKIVCDRGVTHELVRHRLASYSQESSRFCDYSAGKFGGELTFIKPCFWTDDDENFQLWKATMAQLEKTYLAMRAAGARPEEARSILPNSLKTEIFVTMNLRELRHFLKLRTAKAAHPQMREIALKIYQILVEKLPAVFDDLKP